MTWTPTQTSMRGGFLPFAAAPPPARIYEQALTFAAMGLYEAATLALRDVTARAPGHAPAWDRLADLLRLAGKDKEADAAGARGGGQGAAWPPAADRRPLAEIDAAEHALRKRMAEIAAPPEQLKALRAQLRGHEIDVTAMRLLGRLEWRGGDLATARALFERALDLAPIYEGARADLAQLLQLLSEDARAVAQTARLVAQAPANVAYRALHADGLRAIGDLESAIPIMERLIGEEPTNARFRCVYAQALHFAGRREDSVREFRACLELQPDMGKAYWGLAELRGGFLTAGDIAAMRLLLRDTAQDKNSRMLMQYALGQALEQTGDLAGGFAAYEAGAGLARDIAASAGAVYNPIWDADQIRRRRAVFSAPALAARAAPAARPDSTPIFVLGMPRAGSTLVEQILASHSRVEATMELPVLGNITRDLSLSRLMVTPDAYPECVNDLTSSQLAELGARYIEEAAAYRKTDRPYFVDKRPWNWLDAGLIGMILPHAKIIDIRREPIAACFAMYKQMLANDATFSYDFNDLAHYYTQYVGMMAHYDRVMPGRIHFLPYARLVEDTETEIRSLLDYCGLPFEEGCLRFWENSRAVATPSAEQVRRPIFRDALEQWRKFEPWLGPLKDALRAAEAAAAAAPQPAGYEYALTLAAMSMHEAAIDRLRAITARAPTHPGAWRKLAELVRLAGQDKEADEASAAADRWAGAAAKWRPTHDARTQAQLEDAERAMHERSAGLDLTGQMDVLRRRLLENPTDAAAARLLSRLEWQDGDEETSLTLLERTLELSPLHHGARAELAFRLLSRSRFVRALEQTTTLIGGAPHVAEYRAIHSDALRAVGDFPAALAVTEALVREHPRQRSFWGGYGQLLQFVGRRDESARAFRTCLEISATMGEAYWGLADLKSGSLTQADVATMRAHLTEANLEPSSRMYMYYALGHALERAGDFAASFTAYLEGARLFRRSFVDRGQAHSEEGFIERVRGLKRVYTAQTLARRAAPASASSAPTPIVPTPIFIVGMPRAGSTLVEQILASHSQVEGTRELPLIADIMRDLALSRRMITPNAYPDCVLDLTPARLAALGERYLEEARAYRRTDRPFFIDKRPWNWLEVGLIHLILPHARIIDVRREPMSACFAMFKQILFDGADFTYDLHDLGRYYSEYAGLMKHYEAAMPGRIHFLQYEQLVENTEGEVRRLLDYCGLPFESSCLRFWETERTVSTPSANQVRGPIFRDALEQWRNYEPWLAPLKAALSQPPRS
ncbi:MAG: sulfotransferase [Caulobacteraceae bacterium]